MANLHKNVMSRRHTLPKHTESDLKSNVASHNCKDARREANARPESDLAVNVVSSLAVMSRNVRRVRLL